MPESLVKKQPVIDYERGVESDLPTRKRAAAAEYSRVFEDFVSCPHCEAKGRPANMIPLTWLTPHISRSDGSTFHLLLLDRPMKYPHERDGVAPECLSVGFWYVHDTFAPTTRAVSVVLTRPPRFFSCLEDQLRTVADLLAQHLLAGRDLCLQCEFDGELRGQTCSSSDFLNPRNRRIDKHYVALPD
jgi:hypothetical protein